jgi:predicted helicase
MNKATIYYYDIGDYLNREEKLEIISTINLSAKLACTMQEQ